MIRQRSWSVPLVMVALAILSGCDAKVEDDRQAGPPAVVASIFPVGDLVRHLAGDDLRIEVLLPPGASPATFDVTPRQLRTFQDASLFLMIGGGLDEWVADLAQGAGEQTAVIRLSDGIPLLAGGGHEGEGNPHVWLDPILVRDHFLPALVEAISGISPELTRTVPARASALADSLTGLDAEIRESLSGLERRSFLATHAAWSYFARRYDLEEAGVIHSHPGQDPSSREMAHLLEEARDHEIHCLFIEPQLGEVAARALATELSLPTCMLDPLGGPGLEGREGYFQLLRFNTAQFIRGLGGGDR